MYRPESPNNKNKGDKSAEENKASGKDSSPLLHRNGGRKLTITREVERDGSDDDFDYNRQYSAPVNSGELTNIVNNESPGLSVKSNGSVRCGKGRRGSQMS